MRLGSPISPRLRRRRIGAALAGLGLVLAGGTAIAVAPSADPAAAAGTWTTRTAGGMTTQLYVPGTAPTLGTARALMVNLHGCVQTSANLRDGGNWTATAEARGMVVAIPAAPNGGVLLGCWDYYDSNHSRTSPSRHDDNLLQLVSDLLADPALDIDPDQVYLSGLSSGGGETMVMGCLAPDVFAGIGINAGPSVGTTSGQIGSVAVTHSQVTTTCRSFAGSASSGFGSQVTSVTYGSNDTTVAPGYNTLNAQVMAGIYGATSQSSFSLSGLAGNNTAGSGTLWSDGSGPRVSLIQNTGMGHNWPAGGGPGGSYITTNSIDYPAYVTDFFFDNNRRVDRSTEPTDPPTEDPTDPPTDPPTEPGLCCGSATNAQHQAAGRAHSYGTNPYNPYYADVSEDYMGQGDATVTTLQESAGGRFDVVTTC
ncbi:extracellular catalytic domain type 1 short-chain-length polyhydroxyalkanoate depolymerase [Nocardioides luteus]|uniref:Plasmid partitioning protein n=1 Tax=Nocardioides luteus TaxID=1844 RepID=A0A1J4N111_9ACTN|nr:PHB depolymerase family esterase [Nocardioides luteus]OIJ24216.1 plasmid partitioning protein [Nocardioides luteus]